MRKYVFRFLSDMSISHISFPAIQIIPSIFLESNKHWRILLFHRKQPLCVKPISTDNELLLRSLGYMSTDLLFDHSHHDHNLPSCLQRPDLWQVSEGRWETYAIRCWLLGVICKQMPYLIRLLVCGGWELHDKKSGAAMAYIIPVIRWYRQVYTIRYMTKSFHQDKHNNH